MSLPGVADPAIGVVSACRSVLIFWGTLRMWWAQPELWLWH